MSSFQDRPRSAGPTLPPRRCQRCVEDVERSMKGTRRTIAAILTFRKCNKSSLDLPTSTYRSSRKRSTLYFRRQSNIWVWTSSEHNCSSLVNSAGLNNEPQKSANAPDNEVDLLRITTSLFGSGFASHNHFIIWQSLTQILQALRRKFRIIFISLLLLSAETPKGCP